MSHVKLDLLRRHTDVLYVSPFAPFPEVLAPATTRDYTITPAYELPVLAGCAQKLNNMRFLYHGRFVELDA